MSSAQTQITDLPTAQALTGSESVPIVQNGVTVKTTTGAMAGAGALNYPFLTVGSTSGLTQARYLSTGSGLSLADNGAGSTLQITMTGAAASLNSSGTGIQVKTGSNTITGRSIGVGSGLSISNADGVSGDPTISLGTFLSNFVSQTGTGVLAIQSGSVGKINILGTTSQTSILNGDGSGNITVSLANNAVMPGSGSITLPNGTTAQRVTNLGSVRYNTNLQQFEGYTSTGWNQFSLTGGVTSFSAGTTGFTPNTDTTGAVTLGGVLNAANGGTGAATLTGYVYGNGTGVMTASTTIPTTALSGTVTNAQLANSSITINGSSVSLGSSITVTANTTSTLTIGTGLSGGSFNGSTPITIAIDSTVATLTGTQTLTNKTISGASNTLSNIGNSSLTNSSVTYNGVAVALGASGTITAVNPNALTIGTGLSGTSYTGAAAVTIAIDSTVATLTGTQTFTNKSISGSTNTLTNIPNSALTNSAVTVGSTAISLGGTSATLAGLTSVTVTQDPVSALQLATKQYVDSIASGLNYHQPVNYASTAALPSYVYNNGTSGVGATITASANGALSLGGGSPTAGQRVLVKDETGGNAAYNGIYDVTNAGGVSTKFVLTRSSDYDSSGTGNNEIDAGDYVLVISGTNASTAWVQQTQLPIVVGTTALVFLQFNAPLTYFAGTGLNLSPVTTFNISNTTVTAAAYGSASSVANFTVNAQGQLTAAASTSIAINGNQITSGTVGSAYISGSYTGITGVGTLTAGTWNASTIGVGYGGTGLASYTAGDMVYASGTTTLSKLALGTSGYVLTAGASAPTYVAQSTLFVGSATNATNTTNVGITAVTTGATNYLTFVTATTGNLPQLVNSSITANAANGTITGGIAGGAF